MSDNRGIFSLEEFYNLQVSGEITNIFDPFRYVIENTFGTPYGYITAGYEENSPSSNPSNSTVDRIDYANDTATASPKGPLSSARGYHSATGNTSYGYAFGGWAPGERSFIDRIDYSNDTATGLSRGYLTAVKYGTAAAGTTDYGYIVGGTSPYLSSVDRIDYASDTSNALAKGPLSAVRRYLGAAGNTTHGLFVAGMSGSDWFSNVNKIDYSNDTATVPSTSNLSLARAHARGAGNDTYGWFAGGYNDGYYYTTVDRVEYASDTGTSPTKGPLSKPRFKFSTVSTGTYGYYASGFAPGGPGADGTNIDRIDFSNDTATASPKGALPLAKKSTGGTSSRDNAFVASSRSQATRTETIPAGGPAYAFFAGGGPAYPSAMALSSVERIDFSNDTAAPTAAGNLADKQHYNVAVGNQSYGYNCGGKGGPSVGAYPGTRVQRIDYANDSATAVFKGNLTVRRQSSAATGSNSYGYIIGGHNQDIPGPISTVDRIDYADDTSTALTRGTLPIAKSNTMSTGNQSYGYSAGGEPAPAPAYTFTSVDRVDYASDTSTAAPKGNMHRKGAKGAATGNANYGWFSLGDSPSQSTYITRIDYGNDTATSSPKGPLNVAKKRMGATGNGDYGYWSSGAPQPINTKVSRVDYSNDTATAVDKGPMTAGRYALGGLSSQAYGLPSPSSQIVDKGADGFTVTGSAPSYGYTAGGTAPGVGTLSTVRRIDFSNDSSVVNKSNLESAAQRIAAIASPAYGYIAGGAPSRGTVVSRLDLASDTTTTTPKGNLETTTDKSAGVGTKDYGYIAGGNEPAGYSLTQRIDYSNDTATTSPKGYLTVGRALLGATGNTSYGYFTAGWATGASPSARQSTVDRLDYSSDTTNTSPKGHLSAVKYGVGSTGNASYGYVGGGHPGPYSTADRIDYSNDTAQALPKGPLAAAMRYMSSTGNQSYGYWLEGHPGPISTINRIDYSNDTASPSPGNGPNQYYGAGFSAAANALAGPESFIPRIRWVDSADEAPAGTVAPGHAYWGGGGPAGTGKTIVDRLDFSNDSAAMAPKGPLTQSRKQLTAVASPSYVYMMGGYNTSTLPYERSYVDRIDYASDTSTATPKGSLEEASYYAGATGTASYGYNGGGRGSSVFCSVQRIDYSNDTATTSPKGYLTIRRRNFAGCVGNTSYGYWSGGENNASTFISTTERVDFSNDTAAATVKGPVDGPVRGASDGTGNANYGYYAGGYYPDSPAPAHRYSIVSRIDFSSDTGTIPTKAALSDSLSGTGAAGNASYGYWGAGADPSGLKTSVDRIDFSNDTSTPTVVTAYLSNARAQTGAASGLMYGLPQTASAAIAASVQPPFPYPVQAPRPNYDFTTFTFTAANIVGPTGPTLSNLQSEYSGEVWLASYFDSSYGIQLWTPPVDGVYEIELRGATGGRNGTHTSGNGCYPGQGALMICRVTLSGSVQYSMVVGQKPDDSGGQNGSAGGGGSWIYTGSIGGSGLIACAGGGGGWGHGSNSNNGGNGLGGSATTDSRRVASQTSINGRTGNGTGATNGVGQGGGISTTGNYGGGAGGCGWLSDGTDRTASMASDGGHSAGTGASNAWQGGDGGAANLNGGFGGGGGSNGNGRGAGGGGGYTGGPAANDWDGSTWGNGGGGGSYYTGTLVSSSDGLDGGDPGTGGNVNSSNGYIKITLIG